MTDITHFTYLLTLLVSLVITRCCHLVVQCRNTIESSRTVYAWNFIDFSFSPPLSNSSKPSKQSKSASPPSKPLTLAYDGDVDMWSSSRWLYIQSTSWTACNIFKCSSFQGTLWISQKKKKKEERQGVTDINSAAYTKHFMRDCKDKGFGSVVVVKIVTFKERTRHSWHSTDQMEDFDILLLWFSYIIKKKKKKKNTSSSCAESIVSVALKA